jgi:putative N-acetylmannosamine-6-phosphate epimerase
MSAAAAAFAESGHGGPHPKIAPPEQRHEHTTTIAGRTGDDPRQHVSQRRAVARGVMLAHHGAVAEGRVSAPVVIKSALHWGGSSTHLGGALRVAI